MLNDLDAILYIYYVIQIIISISIYLGLRKKMKAIAVRKVANGVLHQWIPSIVDHLYHVVDHSSGSHRVEWWKTCVNHICNIHTHDSAEVPSCKHGPLDDHKVVGGEMRERVWINKCMYKSISMMLL